MPRVKSDRSLFPKAKSSIEQVKVQSFKMSDLDKKAVATAAKSMKMSQRMLIMSSVLEYVENHPERVIFDELLIA